MSAPLIFAFWMRAAFTLVDTLFARRIGDHAVAAIGLTIPFEFVSYAIWVGLSTGLTSAMSGAMARREGANVERYIRAARLQILCVIPAFLAIGAAIYLGAFDRGLEADVAASFRVFGGVLVSGLALTIFWSVLPDSIIKAHQDMRSTMWAGITSNIGNVLLNLVFTLWWGWGVFGLALATTLSRLGGLAYAVRVARRHEDERRARGRDTDPAVDPHPHRTMLALAVPSAAAFMLMATESAIVNVLFRGIDGAKQQIAAYSVFFRVSLFAFQPAIAISVAMLPFSARRFGLHDVAGLRRGFHEALRGFSLYVVLAVLPVSLLFPAQIAAAFTETAGTRDVAAQVMRILAVGCLVGGPFALCRPLFEGMRRGTPGLVVAVLRYVVLSLPAAYAGMALAPRLGLAPVAGMIVGLTAVAAVCSCIFLLWTGKALREAESDLASRAPAM